MCARDAIATATTMPTIREKMAIGSEKKNGISNLHDKSISNAHYFCQHVSEIDVSSSAKVDREPLMQQQKCAKIRPILWWLLLDAVAIEWAPNVAQKRTQQKKGRKMGERKSGAQMKPGPLCVFECTRIHEIYSEILCSSPACTVTVTFLH